METQSSPRRRPRRVWRAVISIVAVAAVLAYAWAAFGLYRKFFLASGNDNTVATNPYARTAAVYPVETADRPALGDPDAELVIVEFSGYQCPACQAQSELIRRVVSLYDGRIRYVFRDFPTPADDWSIRLAEAAACARDQGKFWIMRDRLAVQPRIADEIKLNSIAQGAGLDMASFGACFAGREHQAQIRQDMSDGGSFGVTAAPTVFINGRMISDPLTESDLYAIVDSVFPELTGLHQDETPAPVSDPSSVT